MLASKNTYNVGIFGAGQIGLAIRDMLEDTHNLNNAANITTYDAEPTDSSIKQLKVDSFIDSGQLKQAVSENDIIISALPYDVTKNLAWEVAIQGNRVYLDLTEDVYAASDLISTNKTLNKGSIMIPQCGLAPGAVSILAANMIKKFTTISSVKMKVGALPVSADNALKYHLSWSTAGLVNEYCNACPAVINGKQVLLNPLENYHDVTVAGIKFEAFNTSGGLGSLGDSLVNGPFFGVKSTDNIDVSYQTLRYPGHRDLIKFLLNDLGFKNNKSNLVSLLDRNLPRSVNDLIAIHIEVEGNRGSGVPYIEVYNKLIWNTPQFSAIQSTTAGGVCAVANWVMHEAKRNNLDAFVTPDKSIRNEFIPLAAVEGYKYWSF